MIIIFLGKIFFPTVFKIVSRSVFFKFCFFILFYYLKANLRVVLIANQNRNRGSKKPVCGDVNDAVLRLCDSATGGCRVGGGDELKSASTRSEIKIRCV